MKHRHPRIKQWSYRTIEVFLWRRKTLLVGPSPVRDPLETRQFERAKIVQQYSNGKWWDSHWANQGELE